MEDCGKSLGQGSDSLEEVEGVKELGVITEDDRQTDSEERLCE